MELSERLPHHIEIKIDEESIDEILGNYTQTMDFIAPSCSGTNSPDSATNSTTYPDLKSPVNVPTASRRPVFNCRTVTLPRQFYYAILLLCCITSAVNCDNSSVKIQSRNMVVNSTTGFSCQEVQYNYQALSRAKGFPPLSQDIPKTAISGNDLEICSGDFTCCTKSMEKQLASESTKDFGRIVQDKLVSLRHTLESATSKFDRFFRALLESSRMDLHTMFTKTYGMLYQKESALFATLFHNLTAYYTTGTVDLDYALDEFYTELYRRLFKIFNEHMNLPSHSSDPYWKCVQGQMSRLRPFGDVPDRMKEQVVRSFVASRSFVRGLAGARDIVHKIMDMNLESAECSRWLMTMNYCGECAGFPTLKPCHNLCTSVVNKCLSSLQHIDKPWQEYIEGMLDLLGRLEGPFNIESVIEPIDVEISNAIMIFQENGPSISEKVFEACKRPSAAQESFGTLRRSKRHSEHKLRQMNEDASTKKDPATNLSRLTYYIKQKLEGVRKVWADLTSSICEGHNLAAPQSNEYECWNGSTKDRFSMDLMGNVTWNNEEPSSSVRDEIVSLRLITRQMISAYNAKDTNIGRKVQGDSSLRSTIPKRESYPIDDEDFNVASGSGDLPEFEPEQPKEPKALVPNLPDIILPTSPQPNVERPTIKPIFEIPKGHQFDKVETSWTNEKIDKPEVVLDKPHRKSEIPKSPIHKKMNYPMETDDEDVQGSGSGDGLIIENKQDEEIVGSGDGIMIDNWSPEINYPKRNRGRNGNRGNENGNGIDFDYELRNPHTSIGNAPPVENPKNPWEPPTRIDSSPKLDFEVNNKVEEDLYDPPPYSMTASNIAINYFIFMSSFVFLIFVWR